jgi:Leucine-rich repeat (LRR) protein
MSVEILGVLYDINTKLLDLAGEHISGLSKSNGKLVKQMSELPKSIGKLVKLETLTLANNQLEVIPESIGRLLNLKELYLSNNQLITLPESIGKLLNLKELHLNYNRLNNLPSSILNIKKSLRIHINAYEINNISLDTEFLIFTHLNEELTNLPIGLKEIWIEKEGYKNKNLNHKLPFGCVIKYFDWKIL